MLWVGLSGGIGSGKSTVASVLAGHGVVVIDADRLAREVVQPGTPGLTTIVERFGPEVITEDGALDRAALGGVVFSDPGARKELEAITHPLIAARTRELVDSVPEESIVLHDVPLLVELGYAPRYHLVVIVGASAATRLDRLVRERGMDRAEAERRVSAQADDRERRAVADVWLDNEGAVEDLENAAKSLYDDRLVPYLENLTRRLGVSTDRLPQPAVLARISKRLAYVLEGDLEEPIAADPATAAVILRLRPGTSGAVVSETLARAGFPQVGVGQHAAADPGRPVRLSVREHSVGAGG
ncbi:MAG TPA: dephospho-CoA kinase [Ornithinicoccus sp.]|nr:dephospho-CoA kinase [Ornithinicoccus sp.]